MAGSNTLPFFITRAGLLILLAISVAGCSSQPARRTQPSKAQSAPTPSQQSTNQARKPVAQPVPNPSQHNASQARKPIAVQQMRKKPACKPGSIAVDQIGKGGSGPDWGALYRSCPGSAVAAYNYALSLLEDQDMEAARGVIATAVARHPGFEPLQALQREIGSPFTAVARIANEKLQAWMKQPGRRQEFDRPVPKKRSLPPLPTLVKGEFESSAMFRERVAQAKADRAQEIRQIERRYQEQVAAFNQAVEAYNANVAGEKQKRRARIPEMKRYFLGEAMGAVFGEPRFVDPRYDADRELFNARLVSANGNFDKRISIQVPLSEARVFKASIERVEPLLDFDIVDDRIRLTRVRARFNGQPYLAELTEEIYESLPVSVQLAEAELPQSAAISLLTPERLDTEELLSENAQHFQGALKFEDDPVLAKQRQELAELERRKREAQLQRLKEQERARLQAQIERNRQELAEMGGQAGEEYKGLKMTTAWQFRPARSREPDMVAVVIGNRKYGRGIPPVYYALNDAKAVKQFLVESYGVTPENIIYEEDATKGVMDGIFQKLLRNRVTPGRTDLFVYYSGHGMPVGTDARLLPADARPETADINGYSRDEMLQQLARLDARSLTVVLDACYSGSSKSGQALQAVKAILAEPKRLQAPERSVIISAASGRQTAFMDDQSGHSLLTFYLLKGLSGEADSNHNNEVDTGELQQYLAREVNRKALRLHEQPQNPQVKGQPRVLIGY